MMWLIKFLISCSLDIESIVREGVDCVFALHILQKREKRMLANWKLLTRSLLIRERLKKRYNTEVEPHSLVNLNPVLFRARFSAIRKRERKGRRTEIEKEKPSFRRHRFHPSYVFFPLAPPFCSSHRTKYME